MLVARITGCNRAAVKHFRIGIARIESGSRLLNRHPALRHKYLAAGHLLVTLCLILGKFICSNQAFPVQPVIKLQSFQVFRLQLDILKVPFLILQLRTELLRHICGINSCQRYYIHTVILKLFVFHFFQSLIKAFLCFQILH